MNKLIAHSSRKYALIYSILRDTGLRPIGLHKLTLREIDLDSGTVYPETAKNGRVGALKLKTVTLAMLRSYITKYGFGLNAKMFLLNFLGIFICSFLI